jgi:hypothetical protein
MQTLKFMILKHAFNLKLLVVDNDKSGNLLY